jgi:hypothetical protein
MKSMNLISGMAILLAAMATPLLGGCAADVDSEDATADEAVASNDATTSPDAENIGTESDALFGGYGAGCGWGGVGAGGLGGFGLGGCGFGGFGFGGCGLGGFGFGGCGLGGFGLGGCGIGGFGLGGCGIGGFGLGGFGCGGC